MVFLLNLSQFFNRYERYFLSIGTLSINHDNMLLMYCLMSFEYVFNNVSFELFAAKASINLCATTDCLTVQYSSKTYLKKLFKKIYCIWIKYFYYATRENIKYI